MSVDQFHEYVRSFAERNPHANVRELRDSFEQVPGVRAPLTIVDRFGDPLHGGMYVSNALRWGRPVYGVLRPWLGRDPHLAKAICLLADVEAQGNFVWIRYFGFHILRRAGFLEKEIDSLINELLLAGVVVKVSRPKRDKHNGCVSGVKLNRSHWWVNRSLFVRRSQMQDGDAQAERSG